MDPSKPPGIQLGQIFLQRAQFSHRDDFLSLPPDTALGSPEMRLTTTVGVSPDHKRGIITLRVHTKPEQQPLYEVDVEMTALVAVEEGNENMPIEEYVRAAGPAMVYTFVRQVVADLTGRGRFGPLWLHPVNLLAASQAPAVEGEKEVVIYEAPLPRLGRPSKKKVAKS